MGSARLVLLQTTLTALPTLPSSEPDPDGASPSSAAAAGLTATLLSPAGASSPSATAMGARTPTRTLTAAAQPSATRTTAPSATLGAASPTDTSVAPAPSPTRTATSTAVPPSSTLPPTSTPVPPTATSAPPSSTAVPPSATEEPGDPCEEVSLNDFDIGFFTLRIDVRNRNDDRVEITALRIEWPSSRDRLDRIRFKSNTIWDRGDNNPPTTIDPSEWRSGKSRTINAGDEETLTFVFSGISGSDDYELRLTI